MKLDMAAFANWFKTNRDDIFKNYFQFLKYKSIGTDSSFDDVCKKCAHFLVDFLKTSGLDVTLWQTSGQPIVFAQMCKAGKDRPTLFLYQHYDVQPADPLDLWESDPFEPEIRGGQVYARGAQDNKGQCFYLLTALKAFIEMADKINFNIKVFIEGEEESGSEGVYEILKTKKEELKADYLIVNDTGIPSLESPAITLGVRGVMPFEVEVTASSTDLHSGAFGGVAHNPAKALVRALSKMWDADGRIAIPHFFDDVLPLSNQERSQFDLSVDKETIEKSFGIHSFDPEPGYSLDESAHVRPTLEINGINSGYSGKGTKTIIPAKALAKFSCRLVPNQDPEKLFPHIEAFLKKNLPDGMQVRIHHEHSAPAYRAKVDSAIAKEIAKAYEEVLGKPCSKILTGASIPIVSDLAKVSGADVVLMGYGLDDDKIHAPNEHFGVDRFEKGFLTIGKLLTNLNEES